MSLRTYWLINGVSSKPIQTLYTEESIADTLQFIPSPKFIEQV